MSSTGEQSEAGPSWAKSSAFKMVLATAVVPRTDAPEVAAMFSPLGGLDHSPDGFFQEAHPKFRPVDTQTDGVFLAGCCQGPKDIPDTVAQAKAAASSALSVLAQRRLADLAETKAEEELVGEGAVPA